MKKHALTHDKNAEKSCELKKGIQKIGQEKYCKCRLVNVYIL